MYRLENASFQKISMHQTPSYPFPPTGIPPSPQPLAPRPDKASIQREYREKEGECITMLRVIIRNLTGEELRTRQEILRKAIEILKTAPELKPAGTVQSGASGSTASDNLSCQADLPGMPSMTLTQTVYPTQFPPNHLPQNGMFNTERDGPILYYGAQGQQYQSLDVIAALLRQASPEGYGEDPSNYPQY
ncbi:hypothetical protein JVU11DRAFT_5675 [Chiua virens]|nr:hypothetical protein JVU11DRAFT_5675 [Chiua virens]